MKIKNFVIAIVFILFSYNLNANMFTDVPKDHWAYDAISELASKGYMDGYYDDTFKGEKSISRYELATIVSRIVTKMYNMESSGSFIDEEEAATIRKLITEFKDELKSNANRFDGIEQKIKKLEEQQNTSNKKDKFSLSGDYSTGLVYNHKELAGGSFSQTELGFHRLDQYIGFNVMFTPDDKTEIFLKLSASLEKNNETDLLEIRSENFTTVNYEKKPITSVTYGGKEVDVTSATGTETVLQKNGTNEIFITENTTLSDKFLKNDDYKITEGNKNFVDVKEIHLKVKPNKMANIRIFSNQGQTSYDNYVKVMNSSWNWSHVEPWDKYGGVYSGVEVNGALTKDFSYMSSLLHHNDFETNTAGLRLKYNFPANLFDNSTLFVGTTYTEIMENFTDYGAFESYNGIDFNYALKKSYTLNIDGEIMQVKKGAKDKDHHNNYKGHKIDITYGYNNLKSYLNYYRYDQGFIIANANATSYYASYRYDKAFAGRGAYGFYNSNLDGERHLKWKTKYDYPLKGGKTLKVEGTWLRLWWDKEDNTENYYNYMGEFYELYMNSTMSPNVSGSFTTYLHKDPKLNEIGRWKTTVDINTKLIPERNAKANLSISSERDPDVAIGDPVIRNQTVSGDFSLDINDKVWGKISSEADVENIGTVNEKTTTVFKFNTTVTLTDSMSATGYYEWNHNKNSDDKSHVYKFSITNQFSPKLKLKYGFWRWKLEDDSVMTHNYAKLDFTASEKTSLSIALSPTDNSGKNWFDRYYDQVPGIQRIQFSLNSSF